MPATGIDMKVIVLTLRRISCFPRILSEVDFVTVVNLLQASMWFQFTIYKTRFCKYIKSGSDPLRVRLTLAKPVRYRVPTDSFTITAIMSHIPDHSDGTRTHSFPPFLPCRQAYAGSQLVIRR